MFLRTGPLPNTGRRGTSTPCQQDRSTSASKQYHGISSSQGTARAHQMVLAGRLSEQQTAKLNWERIFRTPKCCMMFCRKQHPFQLFYIRTEEIAKITSEMSALKLATVKGTMRLHQLISTRKGEDKYRDVSCVCSLPGTHDCPCFDLKVFQYQLPAPSSASTSPDATRDPMTTITATSPDVTRDPMTTITATSPDATRDPMTTITATSPDATRDPMTTITATSPDATRDPMTTITATSPDATRDPMTTITATSPDATRDPMTTITATSPDATRDPMTTITATSPDAIRGPLTTTTATSPDASPGPPPVIIQTYADGRCFFRSLVIGMNTNLQFCDRNQHGLPTDPMLKVFEVTQADSLRAAMIKEQCLNFKEYEHLDHTSINVDIPVTVRYDSIQARIASMATPTELIGEIEIIALTRALKQPLHIHMPGGSVITYGEQFSSEKPLTVLFSNLGEHVGHYDYLHTEVPLLVTPLMISPLPEAFRKTPSQRTTQSTILTNSPYKNSLSAKTTEKDNKVLISCTNWHYLLPNINIIIPQL